jgi:hypothetical protein
MKKDINVEKDINIEIIEMIKNLKEMNFND